MNKKFADKIISLRAEAGLSQDEVASRIGTTQECVADWECGNSYPSATEITELANIYNVSPDTLFKLRYGRGHVKVKAPFVNIDVDDDDDDIDDEDDNKNSRHIHSFKSKWYSFPYPVFALVVFLVLTFLKSFGVSEDIALSIRPYAWLVFLTIPMYYWVASLIVRKHIPTISAFTAITIIYLVLGFAFKLWHPAWILFITVPIFDFFFKKKK